MCDPELAHGLEKIILKPIMQTLVKTEYVLEVRFYIKVTFLDFDNYTLDLSLFLGNTH